MQISPAVIALKVARHKAGIPHPFPTPERVGHPRVFILRCSAQMVCFRLPIPPTRNESTKGGPPAL